MILYNKVEKVEKINDIRINRVFWFPFEDPYIDYITPYNPFEFLEPVSYSPDPINYLYNSIIVDNKLYVDVKFQATLNFGNSDMTLSQKPPYQNTNASLIFSTADLSPIKSEYYSTKSTPPNDNPEIYNFSIKTDSSSNIYHIGHTSSYGLNSNNNKINFYYGNNVSFFTLNIYDSNINGYIFKYNSNYNFISAITFHGGSASYDTLGNTSIIHDYLNINNYNFVYLSSDIDDTSSKYYIKKNNTTTEILNDGVNTKNTCAIVKYDENFSNILWYKKFYAATKVGYSVPIPPEEYNFNLYAYVDPTMDNNSWIAPPASTDRGSYEDSTNYTWTNTTNTLNSFDRENTTLNFINDTNNDYIYTTTKVDKCDGLFCYDNNSSQTLITELNPFSYSFVISKIKVSDGTISWGKYISFDYLDSYINKIEYKNNNVYISIKTYGQITINDIQYGSTTPNWKIFVISMTRDGVFNWITELGGNNDDFATDLQIYTDTDKKDYILLSGYYSNSTSIGSYNLSTTGIASYVAKLNSNGKVVGIYHKTSTSTIFIKKINIKNRNLFMCGNFIGTTYIGGRLIKNKKSTTTTEIFVEEIKITDIK